METQFTLTGVDKKTVTYDLGDGPRPAESSFYSAGYGTFIVIEHHTMKSFGVRQVPVSAVTVNGATFDNDLDAVEAINALDVWVERNGGDIPAPTASEVSATDTTHTEITGGNVQAQLNSADAKIHTANNDMAGEVARAQSAETALGTRIDDETTRATTAETALGEAIENEAARAEDIEGSLGERLAAAQGTIAALTAELNEIRALAEQATKGIVFDTTAQLDAWLAGDYTRPDGLTPAGLIVGQDLYTEAQEEPDYWWTGTEYQILQTAKVDLAGYPTRQELTDGLNGKVNKTATISSSTTTVYARTNSSTSGGGTDALKSVSTGTISGHIVMRASGGNIPTPAIAADGNYAIGKAEVVALLAGEIGIYHPVKIDDTHISIKLTSVPTQAVTTASFNAYVLEGETAIAISAVSGSGVDYVLTIPEQTAPYCIEFVGS